MTHAPPVPKDSESPYPIAEPAHSHEPPTASRERESRAPVNAKAGLAAGAIAALTAAGIAAYYLISRKRRSGPATASARKRSGDDPNVRGPRDASRIAMGEDHEVAYWTKRFGVNRNALQAAVDVAGNGTQAVAKHLGKA